jgi:hypothetical protein
MRGPPVRAIFTLEYYCAMEMVGDGPEWWFLGQIKQVSDVLVCMHELTEERFGPVHGVSMLYILDSFAIS